MAKPVFLISYFHKYGRGRAFADLLVGDTPRPCDIEAWEKTIREEHGLLEVGITGFVCLAPSEEPSHD